MSDQIIDIIDVGIPGGTGDVTPEALAAKEAAELAASSAHTSEQNAEMWASNTLELQDSTVSGLLDADSLARASAKGVIADTALVLGSSEATEAFPAVTGGIMFALPSPTPFNGFPGLTRVPAGYLAAFRGGSNHVGTMDGRIYTSFSENGRDWSAASLVDTSDVPGEADVRDPTLATLSNGDVILAWYDGGPKKSYTKRSVDGGETWGASQQLPFTLADYSFLSAPVVEHLTSPGVVKAICYGKDATEPASIQILTSTDYGETWPGLVSYSGASGSDGYLEPNLVHTGGNNWTMLIRSHLGNKIYRTHSTDGGATWFNRADAFFGTGNPHMTRLRDGRIITLYRGTPTGELLTRVSADMGYSWSRAVVLAHSAEYMAYATAVETDTDGEMVCVWADQVNGSNSRCYSFAVSLASGVSKQGGVPAPQHFGFVRPVDEIWVPATDFGIVDGATAPEMGSSVASGAPGWLFDAAGPSSVGATVLVPTWWKMFHLELWTAATTSEAGAVKWEMTYKRYEGEGQADGGQFNSSRPALTVGTAGRIRNMRFLTAMVNNEQPGPWYFRVIRRGTDATDTYPSDAQLLGIRLLRANSASLY